MLNALAELIAPARCVSCRAPGAAVWCARCRRQADALRLPGVAVPVGDLVVHAAFRYSGVVADAIVAAKVRGAHRAWHELGELLAGSLGDALRLLDPAPTVVVPVPTEPRRRRQRGVDHAAVLARGLAARLRIPTLGAITVRAGTPDRGRAGASSPIPTGAYRACRRLPGQRVLLVDDVLTTGATARAAAAAVEEAGAASARIAVLGLARVPGPEGRR